MSSPPPLTRPKRASHAVTSVSRAQNERLPQTVRNYLSFASLASKVDYTDRATKKTSTPGASLG